MQQLQTRAVSVKDTDISVSVAATLNCLLVAFESLPHAALSLRVFGLKMLRVAQCCLTYKESQNISPSHEEKKTSVHIGGSTACLELHRCLAGVSSG